MGKNWLQIVNLCLTALLLVLVLHQGTQLRHYRDQTNDRLNNLRTVVENEVSRVSDALRSELEEAARSVASYNLQPDGIDAKNRTLLADLTVELKTWSDDTAVTLLATVSGEALTLPMTGENGRFTARLALPLEEMGEIFLDAEIVAGGISKRESLGGWSDVSMLLPLRNSGSGWEGPTYGEDGVMRSNFSIHLEGQQGQPISVEEPRFRVYRNGELVQTIHAQGNTRQESGTLDLSAGAWELACDPGDEIEIRFLCEDPYGLGYDFLFANWQARNDETPPMQASLTQVYADSPGLTLFWPE